MKESEDKTSVIPAESGQQMLLPGMKVDIQKTTNDGIEMGVLENGVPYLSQRGLVAMAGIPRTTFQGLSSEWEAKKLKGDGAGINKILVENGYTEDTLYIEIEDSGKIIYAYPEPVCMAVLEYYAFDSGKEYQHALSSYRKLSRAGFRFFIYEVLGYNPQQKQIDSWKYFHDRVDLNYDSMPDGYFSIFREGAGITVSLIRVGVIVNDKMIPDISVGRTWGDYWRKNGLNEKFSERIKYEHNYPDYYPQAMSNPQHPWAYPDSALAEFRAWFKKEYVTSKFPKYLLSQVQQGKVLKDSALKAIGAVKPQNLPDTSDSSGIIDDKFTDTIKRIARVPNK